MNFARKINNELEKMWRHLVDDAVQLWSAHEGQRRFKVIHELLKIAALQKHILVIGKERNADSEDHRHPAQEDDVCQKSKWIDNSINYYFGRAIDPIGFTKDADNESEWKLRRE